MFVILIGKDAIIYGPFTTYEDACTWVENNPLSLLNSWEIQEVYKPV